MKNLEDVFTYLPDDEKETALRRALVNERRIHRLAKNEINTNNGGSSFIVGDDKTEITVRRYNYRETLRERLIEKVEEETGEKVLTVEDIPTHERGRLAKELEARMKEAAENLDFEQAAKYRDQIRELSI